MRGAAGWRSTAPKTFESYAVRTTSAGVSLGLSWRDGLMPALFTRMSSRPYSSSTSFAAAVMGDLEAMQLLKVVGTQDRSRPSR